MTTSYIACLRKVLRPANVFLVKVDWFLNSVLRASCGPIRVSRSFFGGLFLSLLTLLFLLVLIGLK